MALMYTEGASDYIAATPVLVVTFRASGSITAGRIVQFDAGNNSTDVYVPSAAVVTTSSAIPVAGLAIATCASGDPCPVVVWGMVKNLTKVLSTQTSNPGDLMYLSGAGYVCSNSYASGNAALTAIACRPFGRVVSGSGTFIVGFIDTMK